MAAVEQLDISETVLGELYYGDYHGDQTDRELGKIEALLDGIAILYHDSATAKVYAKITAQLTKAGNIIPQNDLWIAAIASKPTCKHFERVEGLTVLNGSEQ